MPFVFPSNPSIGQLTTNPSSGQTFRWTGIVWAGDPANALITASYAFTASYYSGSISNAISSSYALTASYVSGGLFVTESVTSASYSSYALTASYVSGVLFQTESVTSASIADFAIMASSVSGSEVYVQTLEVLGNTTLGDDPNADTLTVNSLVDIFGQTYIWNTLEANGKTTINDLTGSLYGTASWAENAVYALTASFVENAIEAKEITVDVKANEPMNIGIVAHIVGADGTNLLAGIADWTNDDMSANTIGIVTASVALNDFASLQTFGPLGGLNTSGFSAGDLIYLAANGTITNVKPQAPLHSVRLGYVTKVSAGNGEIFVKIDNGYEIEELHDVRMATTSSGDLLVNSGSVWTNSKQLTGSYGLTGSLTATSFTGSLLGTSSWAVSSSNTLTSSLAISASHGVTASFINPLNQKLVLTGSLEVLGPITASSIHTQTITSSISFITGSSKFGSLLTNTHEFTGSVSITGSLTITGSLRTSIYNREIHVSNISGNDTTGNGSILAPYKTITKAFSVVGNTGECVVIHPGTYTESPTITAINVTIASAQGEIGGICLINGTLTINGAASSTRLQGLAIGSLVHSGGGNLYLDSCQVNASFTKSSAGYFEAIESEVVNANITGANQTVFNGGKQTLITVNNAAATVSILGSLAAAGIAVTSGVFAAIDSIIYATSIGGNAINSSPGTIVQLNNCNILQPDLTAGRIGISGFLGYDDIQFDKTNSTEGTWLWTKAHFQSIETNNITGSLFGTASYVNVTGSGVTVNWSGSQLQLTASGGSKVSISATPPVPSSSGDLWYDSDDANLYVLYNYVSASVSASTWTPVMSQVVSAINAISASVAGTAISATTALTASYVNITGSGIGVTYNGSQIQLTGSSFPYTGSAGISGSLRVTGSSQVTGSMTLNGVNVFPPEYFFAAPNANYSIANTVADFIPSYASYITPNSDIVYAGGTGVLTLPANKTYVLEWRFGTWGWTNTSGEMILTLVDSTTNTAIGTPNAVATFRPAIITGNLPMDTGFAVVATGASAKTVKLRITSINSALNIGNSWGYFKATRIA